TVVGGVTYYVAELDPPTNSATSGGGASTTSSASAATQAAAGATGSGPTVAISHGNVLPNDPFGSSFLSPSGSTSTTIVLGGTAQTALIQPGTDFVQNFDA